MGKPSLLRACLGEAVGTFLMVLIGTGVVATAVLTGAQVGLWQVAVVWGIGVTLAIYAVAAVSGAHLNPAITLAFALRRPKEFGFDRVVPYWVSQLAGAALAGLVVYVVFHGFIARFEVEHALVRGAPGSEQAAMIFGEYFPNPAMFGPRGEAGHLVAPWLAATVEGLGTGILAFVVFALVDRKNHSLPAKYLAPALIGATVAVLISLFAPLTQAGWNPARDFGPRIVAFFAGWRGIAIPGPDGGFWVYIVGPLIGAPIGALLYDVLLRPGLREELPAGSEADEGNEESQTPTNTARAEPADVLFVCVHNAGRSQMAKALFNRAARKRGLPYRAESAGTEPAAQIHPNVAAALREMGMELGEIKPQLLTSEMAERARRVVTMGCNVDAGICPAVFIKGVEDWGLPDPKDKSAEEVRAIRDEVARRVEVLLKELESSR